MHLYDTEARLVGAAGDLAIQRVQEIPDEFLETLKSERLAKAHLRAGDYDRVCSVPAQVVDIWTRQGFDIHRASAREILARLRADNLDAFIATPKAV